MPKSKQQKEKVLNELNQRIKDSNSLIISVFDKLPVSEDRKLRTELRKNGVVYEVIKKTLLKKALAENKITNLSDETLLKNISVATTNDEVVGAKILFKFIKGKEDFKILGGLLNKVWIDGARIAELAKLPSKEELIAKTVGTIKAPLNGLVNVLNGNLRGLINTLNAIKNK